ncbi:hypothetical protein FXO38_12254 [Capsicum annuum]|nr:hypothetical protein FXO38_12254 [Capsicum annuum]
MYKNKMWDQIKDNTNATDDMRRILMMSLGTKWKEAKHEAKTSGYDPYDTDIERLAHCPDNVEEDQWRSLVHYWSSENAQIFHCCVVEAILEPFFVLCRHGSPLFYLDAGE